MNTRYYEFIFYMIFIRKATRADYPSFFELNNEVQELHYSHHPEKFKKPSKRVFGRKKFEKYLTDQNILLMFAVEGTQAVGYALASFKNESSDHLRRRKKVIYINHLSVARSHRGKGAATELLSAVFTHARKKKISLVQLDVWSFNREAIAFFTKKKFVTFNLKMECSL